MGKSIHHNLLAWKESMKLVGDVYQLTQSFPREELYGLTNQIRRAAVSIPSNIAEGAARTGQKEFVQFLNIAKGSLSELETQLLIAQDLQYLPKNNQVFNALDYVARLLGGLHRHIKEQ